MKRVEIPKPDGNGVRQLGIPTVMDRIIQQAIHQEIVLIFEPIFSQNSYGFIQYRSAHQAVTKAHEYIQEGYEWVADIDLEKFFDKVNHDMLMARVARHVKDKKILLLIRRYLQVGIMEDGLVKPTEMGTPQGGIPAAIEYNAKRLRQRAREKRASICEIRGRLQHLCEVGKRVMETATRYLTQKLKLKVNQQKSTVDNPWNRKFLEYTFTKEKEPNRIAVHESRIKRFKDKIRSKTKKLRGSNIKMGILKEIMPITQDNRMKIFPDIM